MSSRVMTSSAVNSDINTELDPRIDPQFACYLRDDPKLSYSHPDDPWFRRQLVAGLELLFGSRKMEAVYSRLKEKDFNVQTFFAEALDHAGINVSYEADKLASIPKSGPLMFVANHPFGVVDGVVLCDLALRARGDLRIMLHALLCQDRQLAPYFLPIDFENNKNATRTNIRSKQLALEYLSQDIPVLIFPSGMVSTASKLGFGPVSDGPWTTFAAKIIRDAKATVVPFYFHGQNSRKFHVASYIAEPLRMALLVHEALKKFGETVRVEIGDPISWEVLQGQGGRSELTSYLYGQVQELKPKA